MAMPPVIHGRPPIRVGTCPRRLTAATAVTTDAAHADEHRPGSRPWLAVQRRPRPATRNAARARYEGEAEGVAGNRPDTRITITPPNTLAIGRRRGRWRRAGPAPPGRASSRSRCDVRGQPGPWEDGLTPASQAALVANGDYDGQGAAILMPTRSTCASDTAVRPPGASAHDTPTGTPQWRPVAPSDTDRANVQQPTHPAEHDSARQGPRCVSSMARR